MVVRGGLGWMDGSYFECLILHTGSARAKLVLEGYSERHSLKPRATDQASICDELGGRGTCCRQLSVEHYVPQDYTVYYAKLWPATTQNITSSFWFMMFV